MKPQQIGDVRILSCMPGNLIAIALLLATVDGLPAGAQTYSVLYNFDETHGCCAYYSANLAQGQDGNIYGASLQGGAFGYGTVFMATPSGVLTVLHSFDITDGLGPQGGVSMGLDGNFYGTTYQGGSGHAGTVFKITPGGTLTVLYSFLNSGDGAYPRTPPVPAPDGNLYGATANHAASTLYRITPTGTLTVLATLPAESDGPLVLAADGKLYGITLYGGTFNQGTAFSLTTAGVYKTIYSFDVGSIGNSTLRLLKGNAFPGRSRPLCAYPKHAQYTGQGDPNDARNFRCQ